MSGIVAVVDDDSALRDAILAVLDSVGIATEGFESAQKLLGASALKRFSCIVMDIRMPGLSGIEAHRKLKEVHVQSPVIFITGHGDIEMAVEAMKRGAADFITKPFRDQVLIDAVQAALLSKEVIKEQPNNIFSQESLDRFSQLTRRERQVLEQVVQGRRSKQIAADLCLAVKTVEEYRSRLLVKLKVRSSTELVSVVSSLGGIPSAPSKNHTG